MLALSACLDPGPPVLPKADGIPPFVQSTNPPFAVDGGVASIPQPNPLIVTFNEQLDPRSVRAGLFLVRGEDQVATRIEVPQPDFSPADNDVPYDVQVFPEEALTPGVVYVLVVSTLVMDAQGNPMAEEVRFSYQVGP
jgi:hypothetical protein